jgi:hypothetical protein
LPLQLTCPRYRDLCVTILSADFEFASANGIENKLWTAHVKANAAFRGLLKNVRHMPPTTTALCHVHSD